MTTYRKDPTFYGDNALPDAFSTASTVALGSSTNEWRDDTSHPGDGLQCLITQSNEYSSTGANSVKFVSTGVGLAKTTFINTTLTPGVSYEISFKLLVPKVPSTAEPTAYLVSVGGTPFSDDLATSGAIGVDSSTMIEGQWIQAHSLIWKATGIGAYFTIAMVANNIGDILFLDEIYVRRQELTWSADSDPT